ncbi:hypothetical protein UlMin_034621 [Ulmus minor]
MDTTKILFQFVIYLSCSCVLSVFGSKECNFPAIFNFGDSNSDTGGLASAFPAFLTPPYGETYFREPSGRFSDGRLVIDFIAQSYGLPYLSAYLDSQETTFKHGANFATAASTIRLPKQVIPNDDGYSPFYLDVQYTQFVRLKSPSRAIRNRGEKYICTYIAHIYIGIEIYYGFVINCKFVDFAGKKHAKLVPQLQGGYFKEALYTFDIGQNDIAEGIFANMSLQQLKASVPDIISHFTTNFKNIYNISGGRSFWIHNTGPIGCLAYVLTPFPSAERDEAGCAKPYNEVAQHFNYVLKQAVVQLRKEFPSAAITYVDIYSVKYSLFKDPHKYGFELPLVTCCGYGGKYNYSDSVGCGGTVTVNGSQIYVGSCERPSVRVNWDGIHYTEAANKVIFDKISTGAFSDPPLPLNRACIRA